MRSIQLDPTLICWTWAATSFISVGLYKSSTRMTRGRLWVEVDASVARESACVFPLLGMWCRLNDSILTVGTWLDLSILASSHPWLPAPCLLNQRPFLNPKTPLQPFPPFFEPWILLPIKPHIQSRYSWLRTPVLVTSRWWASQVRLKLAPLPSPFDLPLHQHILSRREVFARRSY